MTVEAVKVIERRVKPRIETKVKVKFVGEGGSPETFSGNLSKSGVFLEMADPFIKVGEKVQFQVTLPNGGDPIKVVGKVVRVVKPNQVGLPQGIGIHFLRIETRHARTFDRLIDRLLDARGIGCRKFPRAKTQIIVELNSKKQTSTKVISDNMSKGGMFLKMSTDGFVLGDTLNVVILHPTAKRKFSIDAEIVHIRKGESKLNKDFVEGVGVQFFGLTATRRNDMSLFFRSILSSQKRKSK